MALATLPGVYAYSDAGNGIGYSYLSIRGFPQRRISVLDQRCPAQRSGIARGLLDRSSRPARLDRRGAGAARRGLGPLRRGIAGRERRHRDGAEPERAAFRLRHRLRHLRHAARCMAEGNSGPIAGGWLLYGRYSRIETDGYRDQSDTHLWSYALSVERERRQTLAQARSLRRSRGDAPRLPRDPSSHSRRRRHRRRRP